MRRCDRGGNLHDTRIKGAGECVNLAQKVNFGGERRLQHRIIVRIKLAIGARRGGGHRPAAVTHGKARSGDGAFQGMFINGGGMGVACGFATYGAQTKPFGCIKTGGFNAPIVK